MGARLASALAVVAVLAALALPGGAGGATPGKSRSGDGSGAFKLTATSTGSKYAPTFTGDGVLGVRVPPEGQGYAPGSVPALSELAGFYAQPKGEVQQRANIPTWSTLRFYDKGRRWNPGEDGDGRGWRQTVDLRTGVITTRTRIESFTGEATDLRYEVLTDRARPNVGLVRLRVTPHWSGFGEVDDQFVGKPALLNVENKPAGLTGEVAKGTEADGVWDTVRAAGTGIEATLADRLVTDAAVEEVPDRHTSDQPMSIGRRLQFPVEAGHSYTFTKYVDVESSNESADTLAAARAGAAAAAGLGWKALTAENAAAWAKLWRGRIEVLGDPSLARKVNASQFYLWSSTNDGVDWSVSPAGLSSNGYNGHIFWDAETWMFPSLLAQHPELAAGMDAYRFERLAAARAHASETGFKGARFPWESALDGTEQIPPPVRLNSEGLYEQHIVADVALAQWQYYLATGDKQWLAEKGWPVISGAAEFWAGRAKKGKGGFHIDHVTGPDEENPNVSDEAYTNVAAKTVLEDATSAAKIVGASAPPRWSTIAAGLVVPFDRKLGIHPEFDGYGGQLVKQADVTLMQYPWQFSMAKSVAQADLDYYVPRSDPEGPSMTDAVSMLDAASIGTPGCSTYVFTRRSYEPFIKDSFDQFSETRTGGAFTFMTGIGGFLQEFLYGYSGLRWEPNAVALDPSLTSQLHGLALHELHWRGRTFDVKVGSHQTTVTLDSGAPLPVKTGGQIHKVRAGAPLTIPTRRPDLTPTSNPLRCQAAKASSAHAGAPALAAVDGSPATDWEPTSLPATLTVPLHGTHRLDGATLRWGATWPPPPKPNVHPPARPVIPRRATAYTLEGSADGSRWQRLASVKGRAKGTVDHLHFPSTRVRFLRLKETAATEGEPPLLEELESAR
ncbi:MAG TPA: glycosyl hydrolase family 65 protein [Solirubrobacterales bacterium]|nr:glycosyl hydrolase family 65 protein [Solirubrobacterales bacterium]